MIIRVVIPLAVAAAACACSPTAAPRIAHVLFLHSIGGQTLPAPEYVNTACGTMIVADTLVLYEDGTGSRRTARDVPSWTGAVDPVTCEPAASSPRQRRLSRASFAYRQAGDRVEIDFPCPDDASCVAPPHLAGTLSELGLVVDHSRSGVTPMVYFALLEQ
jgi:hypothetical protein